ncbi:uncharacterized protein LOC142222318 isoform X1 [Haematobia irritans]|uniref:uncharacterized protein LOC142222318 isoform X1 n=1 Tax=Haematobia irritans TaxID=7368 RepID=UPI003F508BD4
MKCDELNDDDIDLDTEEEFISIKPSGDSSKDLGGISIQQQQRCYTPQQSQVKEKIEKGTEEEFIQIEPSGDSSKDLDNISDQQQQQCLKSQIKENIQKGIYTVHYDSKGKGNVWNILRKIQNQDNLYVEGYAWCTQCCNVVSDKSPTRNLHECCKKFSFSQIAENIKNGVYTLNKYYRLRNLWTILRKIVDENNSPIDGYLWCIKCRTVLLDYKSNRANHKCSKDLKRKLAKDSVKQQDRIAKHLAIATQIENGTYTLSDWYTTKTMRRILKADKTLVEGYVFCNQCRKVYSDYASQKNTHSCYRDLKYAPTKDITDDYNNIKSNIRRFEIAEKLEKGIYTLAKHQSTSFVWTFMRKILKEDKTPIEDFTCCIKCGDVISSRTMTNISKHKCCNELMKFIHEGTDEDEDHVEYHTKAELRAQIAQKIQQGSYTLIERNSRAYIWKIIRNIQREDDKTLLKGYVFCIECENVHRFTTTENLYAHKCCKILKELLLKKESEEGIAKKIAQGIYTVTSMKSSSYLRNLMMVIVKEDKTIYKDYVFCSKCRKVYSIVRAVHLYQHKCYGESKSYILKQKEVNDDNDAVNDENRSRQDSACDEDWRIEDQHFYSSKGAINDESFTISEQDEDLPWDNIKLEETEFCSTMTGEQVIELESDKNSSDQDDLGQDSAINTKDEGNTVISDDNDGNISRQDSASDEDWRIADQDFPSSKGVINDKSFTNSEQDKENILWDNIKLEEPEFGYTMTGEIVIEIESDENSSNQDDIGQDSAINTKDKGNTVISDDDDDENISRHDSSCDKDCRIADQDIPFSKGVINDKSFTNSEQDKENLLWDNIKLEEPEFGYTVTGDIVIELESDENSSNQDDIGQDSAIKTKDKGNTVSVEDDNDNRSRQDSACDEDWRIADQDFSSSKGLINDKSFTNSKQDEDRNLPKTSIRKFEVAEKLGKGIYTLAKHQSRSYVWIFMRKILKEDGTDTGYARCMKCGTVRASTCGNLYSHRCCKFFRESLLKKSDSLKKSKEDEIAQKIAQGIDTVTSMKSDGYLSKFIKAIVKEDKTIYKNYVFCSKCRKVYSVVRVYQHKCYGEFKSSILKQKDVSDDNDGDDADNDENISRQDAACDKDLRTADQDSSSSKGVINDKSFTNSEQDEDLPWDNIKLEEPEFGYTMTGEQVIQLQSDESSSNQDDLGQYSAITAKDDENNVISDDSDKNIPRQDSACDEDWRIADQDFSSSKGVINDKSFTTSEQDKDILHWDNIKIEEAEFGYTTTGEIVIEIESDENSSNQDDIGQDSAIKTKDKGNTVSVENDNDNRSGQDSACDEDWRIADIDFSSSKGMINDKSFTNSEQDKEDLPSDNIKIEDTELGCTMTGEQVIELESDENSSNQDDLGLDSPIKTNDKGNTVRSDDADDDDNISHKDSACDEDWRIEDAQLNNRKTITISNEVYTISQKRKNRCPIWNVLAEILRNDNSVLPGYVYCRRCESVLTYKDLDTLNNHICCSKKDILQIEYENDLALKKYGNNMKLIKIAENIENGLYTSTKYCGRSFVWKILRRIVDENKRPVDGYVWCTKCNTVLVDYPFYRTRHKCSMILKRATEKEYLQNERKAECLANQIENGNYTLTYWYTTKKYVQRIMQRILKADKTLVEGYVFCNQCRRVFSEYGSQQDKHQCYRDLINDIIGDDESYAFRSNTSNLRRFDIAEKLDKGIYTLTKQQGTSYLWKIMRNILKEDKTPVEDYMCCIKCGTICSSHSASNLNKHKCSKELRKSMREDDEDKAKDHFSNPSRSLSDEEFQMKPEFCSQIAQKIQLGIYTLIERKSRGYIWKIIRNIQRADDKTLLKGYVCCIECRNVYCTQFTENLYVHRCCKILKKTLLKESEEQDSRVAAAVEYPKIESLNKSEANDVNNDEIAKKIAQGLYTVTSMKRQCYVSQLMKLILKEDKAIYKDYVFCIKCRKVYSSLNTSNLYQHKCYREFKRSIFKKRAEEDDDDDEDENISRQDSDCDEEWIIKDQDFSSSIGVINDKSFITSDQDEDADLPWDNIQIEDTEFGSTMASEQFFQFESDEKSSNQDSTNKTRDKQNSVRSEKIPKCLATNAKISEEGRSMRNNLRKDKNLMDYGSSNDEESKDKDDDCQLLVKTKNRKESRSSTPKDVAKLCDFLEETKTCQESKPSTSKDTAKICDFLEENKNRKDPSLAKSKDAAEICDFTEETKNHKESRPSTSRDAAKICDFTEETKNRWESRPFASKDSAKNFEFLEETKKLITTNSDRLKRKIPQDEDELETVESHETNMNNMKAEMMKPTNFSKKFKHGQSFNPDKKISSSIDSIDPQKFLHSQASTSSLGPQLNSRDTIQILNEVYTISRKKAQPKSHLECLSPNP